LEQSEVETLIEELETRVDRLRALYEQYFIGIERLEPGVPRKDVERRFYVLRRTQIRNTALRFRFQNVLLRYNTYQTYWIRICRQIEEGTYKRDVRRANARFSSTTPAPAELAGDDLEEVHDTAPPSTFELDIDFDASDDVSSEDARARALAAPATLPDVPLTALRDLAPARPLRPAELPKGRLLEVPATPTERQVPFGLPIVDGRQPKKETPPPPRKPSGLPPLPPQASASRGKVPSPPPVPRTPPPRPPPRPAPAAAAAAAAAVGPQRKKSRQSMPKVAAQPPAGAAHPAATSAAASPKAAPKGGDLSDERVRQIYKQYVETKRSLKESTASLTFDSLAKSIRESSDKLREKHMGKSVDFEVAVKNGKTILRPVVK